MAVPIFNVFNLNGRNGFSLIGEDGLSGANITVSNAGDINGDGFDDVRVSTVYTYPPDTVAGASYVVFGKASGFDTTLDLSSLDGSNGFH